MALTIEQGQRLLAGIRQCSVYWPVLIALATGSVYWPVLIALATGMRRGETLALRWRNADLDRGEIRVVDSVEPAEAGLRFKRPKTDKPRVISLSAFALDELRRRRREQARMPEAQGAYSPVAATMQAEAAAKLDAAYRSAV